MALAGLAGTVLAAGFLKGNAPITVTITHPMVFKAGERNPLVTAAGYVVARHRATLSAKVPGRLEWLGVEEGSHVRKGQVIARLENPDLQAQRDQCRAALIQAAADLARGEELTGGGVMAQADLDRLRTAHAEAKAQLAYQEALLENMVVRAPFGGTITRKISEVGETVNPGTAGGLDAVNAIATLADFGSLEVEVEVGEGGITKLRKGMPAEIRVDAFDGDSRLAVLKGRLREICPTSDRQKAVVLVRVAFLEASSLLLPDMGAKVTFLGEPYPRDVTLLGREQVVLRGGRPCVWVQAGDRAALQPVHLGAENPLGVEVTGLAMDARLIVVSPDIVLEPGARIRTKDL